ncbi:MAG: ABC transporter permease [Planctomycetota bacterium]|nr:ABC transporter permease [Planctomycetota bacterium]
MTDATIEPAQAAAGNRADPGSIGLFGRWSDLLNPILVREVQQALRGRLFLISVAVALLFSLGLATYVAGLGAEPRPGTGRETFGTGLMGLTILVLFVVPVQAFQSMRVELREGISDQLLLSRLKPWRIITGKLAAAMVQFVLYLAVLAPVLSTTYLLRGVSVPLIALCIGFALLFCVTATALTIAAAAQNVSAALQPVSNFAVLFLLGLATLICSSWVVSGELLRELDMLLQDPEFWMGVGGIVLLCVVGIVFAAMVGAALLAHSYENRSTPFRIFLLVATGLAFAWVYGTVPVGWRFQAVYGTTIGVMVASMAFGWFFVTEPTGLSPRQCALLPRSKLLRLAMLPLLPGRDRGLVFLLLMIGGLFLLFWLQLPEVTVAPGASPEAVAAARRAAYGAVGRSVDGGMLWRSLGFIAVYTLIYLMLTKLLRNLLPDTQRSGHAARVMLPLLLLFCILLPVLLDVMVAGGANRWHPGHILNPFWTFEEFYGRSQGWDILWVLSGIAGVLLLCNLRGLWRSTTELLNARALRDKETAVAGQ